MTDSVVNTLYREHMRALDLLGANTSRSLFNLVRNHETRLVGATVALFAAIQRYKNIEERESFFLTLLNNRSATTNANAILKNAENPDERKAMFDYWLSLSIKYGQWNSYKDIEGSRYVFIDGQSQEKFIDIWNRGWNVDYLVAKIPVEGIHRLITPEVSRIEQLGAKSHRPTVNCSAI